MNFWLGLCLIGGIYLIVAPPYAWYWTLLGTAAILFVGWEWAENRFRW